MSTITTAFAGNTVGAPSLRYTSNGQAVANLRVIVNHRTKNQTGDGAGEWVDAEPTGYDVTVWGKPAEHVAESITKGDRVLVIGTVETQAWNDRESGEKRTKQIVIADEIGLDLRFGPAKTDKRTSAQNGQD